MCRGNEVVNDFLRICMSKFEVPELQKLYLSQWFKSFSKRFQKSKSRCHEILHFISCNRAYCVI